MKNYLKKNYSKDDLRKLINENQKKINILNKMINKDIYFNMIPESNSPLKEREKYFKRCYKINNRFNFGNELDKSNISNFYQIYNPQNNISVTQRTNRKNIHQYNFNDNNNDSFDINKSEYGEKKHFPLLTNKGNHLRIVNQHLIPTNERLKLIKRDYHTIDDNKNNDYSYRKYSKNNLLQRYKCFNREENKSFNNQLLENTNLLRNNSMLNISDLTRNKMIRKKLFNSNNNKNLEDINKSDNSEKHYNRQRYDYEGSRFGDQTYNFYLNEPMRSDIKSLDWKFPPIYRYNYKNDYGKNFQN